MPVFDRFDYQNPDLFYPKTAVKAGENFVSLSEYKNVYMLFLAGHQNIYYHKKKERYFMQFEDHFVHSESVWLDGEKCVKVVKAKSKLLEFDADTYARISDISFHNGVIEADVRSRLLADAPDYARGFIGLAFRIQPDDSAFECLYIRPTNGIRMTDDPVRQSHAVQYFSYPKYTFAWFRKHDITAFEAKADIMLDEWIHLKAVITDETASLFINDMKHPVLTVDSMYMGAHAAGGVGLFVDIGTEGLFRNIVITPSD